MNIIETQRARIQALEKRIQELESTSLVPSLEKEITWLEGIIYNPSYNETDMRLLLQTTPREMRMGLTSDVPERTVYLPELAKRAHCEAKTASKRFRRLANTGMLSYRTAVDPETGHTRARLAPLAPMETAPITHIERAKPGGSTWEDGKRVTRCKDCDSPHLAKKTTTQTVCLACGAAQDEAITTIKPINPPDSELEGDHRHNDTDPPSEDPKLPSNVYTQGGNAVVETSRPPAELRALPIWCTWRYGLDKNGKPTKVPYQARGRAPQKAESDNPRTWVSYEQAQRIYEEAITWNFRDKYDGIGFMCDGSFVGIDLDHCRNKETGEIAAWAQAIIERFSSYGYITPSEEGVRIIIHANKPGPRCKKDDIEIYEETRFFTWTPMQLPGTPEAIEDRQEQMAALYAETFPKQESLKEVRQRERVYTPSCPSSDDEILRKARGAANGAKFCRLYDDGNITGYASQSEAELAICSMLAYYSDNDEEAIDRLMRKWRLFRPEKWDRAARSGETYGQGTIRVALREQIAS